MFIRFRENRKKSVLTSEFAVGESKMAEIPPCSLDAHVKTAQLATALIWLPICCLILTANTVISQTLD